MAILGLDLSHHQDPSQVDWPALRAAGYEFVIVRACYGSRADRRFVEHVRRANEATLRIGAYLFYRQTEPVERQLAAFRSQLDAAGELDLFPTLDLEDNRRYDGAVQPVTYTRAALEILPNWVELHGGAVLYYSSYFPEYLGARLGSGRTNYWRDVEQLTGLRHWLADYDRTPGQPRTPYTREWHLHQPRPRAIPEYAEGKLLIDVDILKDGLPLADLIAGRDEGPSGDANACEVETSGRPGGPDEAESKSMIRHGIDLVERGLRGL